MAELSITDFVFEPLSDVGANDVDIINEHTNLINNNQFSAATELTDKGFSAAFFNYLLERVSNLGTYAKETSHDEYIHYSYNDPNVDEMPSTAKLFVKIIEE